MKHLLRSILLFLVGTSFLSAKEPVLLHTLVAVKKPVFCLAFSPDSRVLASGGAREVRIFDVLAGSAIAVLDDPRLVGCVTFSPDSHLLGFSTALGSPGRIRLWDLRRGEFTATLNTHSLSSLMAFALDGKTVLWTDDVMVDQDEKTPTSPPEMVVKQWDMQGAKSSPICTVRFGQKEVQNRTSFCILPVAFSHERTLLVLMDDIGTTEVWNVAVCRKTATFSDKATLHDFSTAFSWDGKALVSACTDKKIRIWNAESGRTIVTFPGHGVEAFCVAFSPDGATVASGGHHGTVKLWDVATGRNTFNLDAGNETVNCVVFAPDGKTLASAGHTGVIKLWSVGLPCVGPSTLHNRDEGETSPKK